MFWRASCSSFHRLNLAKSQKQSGSHTNSWAGRGPRRSGLGKTLSSLDVAQVRPRDDANDMNYTRWPFIRSTGERVSFTSRLRQLNCAVTSRMLVQGPSWSLWNGATVLFNFALDSWIFVKYSKVRRHSLCRCINPTWRFTFSCRHGYQFKCGWGNFNRGTAFSPRKWLNILVPFNRWLDTLSGYSSMIGRPT